MVRGAPETQSLYLRAKHTGVTIEAGSAMGLGREKDSLDRELDNEFGRPVYTRPKARGGTAMNASRAKVHVSTQPCLPAGIKLGDKRVSRAHVMSAYQPRELDRTSRDRVVLPGRPNASLGHQVAGSWLRPAESQTGWDAPAASTNNREVNLEQQFLS